MTMRVSASVVSDVGCKRTSNEDCGTVIQPADAGERDRRGVLAIVADGMGGHSAGEVASAMAVEEVRRLYYAGDGAPGAALEAALHAANQAIFAHAGTNPAFSGMGTTCVALVMCGDLAYACNVGDSRLYLVRAGRIYQMTVDDSAVGALVNQGVISKSEAKHHEDRNVILRALGTHPSVTVSGWPQPFPVREGDAFVLCSDGLTDLVSDEEILARVSAPGDGEPGRDLVELAKARGGFDNITVAILRAADAAHERPAVSTTRELPVTS